MMVKIELLQVHIVPVLVLQTLYINATANIDTQQITYSHGATTPVCVLRINYTNCSDPGIKLNYHSPTSSSSVGILLYNELYRPDRVVARKNTTEYGFVNVTSERNESSLCLYFMEMSAPANGSIFSLEQICGVTKLDREKKYYFKFILVPTSLTSTYPPTTRIGHITSSSSATNTSTSSYTSQKPKENQRNNKKSSTGKIVGIVLGSVAVIFFSLIFYCKCKERLHRWFSHYQGRRNHPKTGGAPASRGTFG